MRNSRLTLPISFLLLAVTVSSCSPAPPAPPPPAESTPVVVAAPAREPVGESPSVNTLLVNYLAAWNAHDIDRTVSFFADDASYFEASTGNVSHGHDDIERNIVSVLMRAAPDLRRELRGTPIVQGNAIAYEWLLTGTNTGTWNGVPATRQKIHLGGVTVLRVRDGRIVSESDYYDVNALNLQMGWR